MKANPSKFQKIVSYPLRVIGHLIAFPFAVLHYTIKWIFWPYDNLIKIANDSEEYWKKAAKRRAGDLEIQKTEFERLRTSKHKLEVKYQRLLLIKRKLEKDGKNKV